MENQKNNVTSPFFHHYDTPHPLHTNRHFARDPLVSPYALSAQRRGSLMIGKIHIMRCENIENVKSSKSSIFKFCVCGESPDPPPAPPYRLLHAPRRSVPAKGSPCTPSSLSASGIRSLIAYTLLQV